MIGVFDSGIGGLSALAPLRTLLPQADILYIADTASLPLGEKHPRDIRARMESALSLFRDAHVDAVLFACGTASSLLTDECKARFAFPIFDIITPTQSAARSLPRDARIALLSTEAAAKAGSFASALAVRGERVYSLACPTLIPMVEKGAPYDPRTLLHAMSPLFALSPTALVLGCTHFSLVKREIAAYFPAARLLDPAACAAAALAAYMTKTDKTKEAGMTRFLVTRDPNRFARAATRVLGSPVFAEQISFPT